MFAGAYDGFGLAGQHAGRATDQWSRIFYVFFQISKKRDFLRFLKLRIKKSPKVFSKSLLLNPSK